MYISEFYVPSVYVVYGACDFCSIAIAEILHDTYDDSQGFPREVDENAGFFK